MMDQRVSIGLRSGEAAGYTINLLLCMPKEPGNSWVPLAERTGALSCLNTKVLRRDSGMSSSQ